jgi:hypothetical protein
MTCDQTHSSVREQLRTAHELFTTMGTEAFTERSRRELLATGETARKRTIESRGQLTAREAQIARFARDGLSNPEIVADCSSAPAPSNTTCTRSSASSTSARAPNFTAPSLANRTSPNRSSCPARGLAGRG